MHSKGHASSFSLPALSSLKESPARLFSTALTALAATLTVALTALIPAPANAQAGAVAYTEKTDTLLSFTSNNLFGVTYWDLLSAADLAFPPASAAFQYVDGALVPQDTYQFAYDFAFAGPNTGYAFEQSALSSPFDTGIGLVGQGMNVTHYAYALAPAAGSAYGSPITVSYFVGDPVPLLDNGSGDFVPEPFYLVQDDYNALQSGVTKPNDAAYSFTYNEVGYEYLTSDYQASYGGTTLYASYAETFGNATFTSDANQVLLTVGAGGSSYYGFGSDDTWITNPVNGSVWLTDSFFQATGDFAFLPWQFAFGPNGIAAYTDWSGLFTFGVVPDVVGDPDASSALVITNYLYTETYAFTAVPEPSAIVTGIIFGVAVIGGVLRGRIRRA